MDVFIAFFVESWRFLASSTDSQVRKVLTNNS